MLATRKEAGNAKSADAVRFPVTVLMRLDVRAETEGCHSKMCPNSPSTDEDESGE